MVEHISKYRVPYGHVDRMGFLYHSHYLELFDLGRTELIRNLGLSNLQIEEMGYQLPVCNAEINYKRPAFYDDILEIKTTITQLPKVSINFNYEIYRYVSADSEQIESTPITTGMVKLAFLNVNLGRAVRPPKFILDVLKPYFAE